MTKLQFANYKLKLKNYDYIINYTRTYQHNRYFSIPNVPSDKKQQMKVLIILATALIFGGLFTFLFYQWLKIKKYLNEPIEFDEWM